MSTQAQDVALVLFSRSDSPLLGGLLPGFGHCFVYLPSGTESICVESVWHEVYVERLQMSLRRVCGVADTLGCEWIMVRRGKLDERYKVPALLTCVNLTKRLLGIECWAQTPLGLFRVLDERGLILERSKGLVMSNYGKVGRRLQSRREAERRMTRVILWATAAIIGLGLAISNIAPAHATPQQTQTATGGAGGAGGKATSSASASSKSSSRATSRATGGKASSSATGGDASAVGDVDVSQDGDKSENTGIAIAPPSFSYAPGAAVGECVATESYAVGLPLLGGGFGQQTLALLPGCVPSVLSALDAAFTGERAMAAACVSPFVRQALASLNVDCDAVPVGR